MQLHRLLKQYWGYNAFRPRQEEVIQCLLDGRDAVAVMPTGGAASHFATKWRQWRLTGQAW